MISKNQSRAFMLLMCQLLNFSNWNLFVYLIKFNASFLSNIMIAISLSRVNKYELSKNFENKLDLILRTFREHLEMCSTEIG